MNHRLEQPGRGAAITSAWFALAGVLVACGAPQTLLAELPPGWSVEVFAGRIVDIAAGGGLLACATDGGLLFFEPASGSFRQIADTGCPDTDCLRSNRLTAVARDAMGQYWVGTQQSGVSALRPEAGGWTYSHFFVANLDPGGGLLSDMVTSIATWRDEAVYVGSPSGVAQIDLAGTVGEYNEESSRPRGANRFPDSPVNDVAVDSLYVWAATDSGVVRYPRLPPHDIEVLRDSLAGLRTYALAISDGRVFAGTERGVHVWDEASGYWRRFRNRPESMTPTPNFPAYSLAIVDAQTPRLSAGSDVFVWHFDNFSWSLGCTPAGIPLVDSRAFLAVAATGDTLWTSQVNASGEGGYLDSWLWGRACVWGHHEPNAIPASDLRHVDLGSDGRTLWLGTWVAGVARRAPDGQWCTYNGNDPTSAANMTNSSGFVSSFLADAGDKVWFSLLPIEARAPVDKLVPAAGCVHTSDTWDHIDPDELGFGGRYWKIAEDGAGNRFFLSDGDPVTPMASGLDVLSADESRVGNLRADVLGGSAIGAITFDTASGPWSVAYVGVNNVGDQGLKRWRRSGDDDNIFDPQPGAAITSLPLVAPDWQEYRDMAWDAASGDLWVATNNGLFRYDTSPPALELRLYAKDSAEPGLLSPDVRDLELDDLGNLWIGTTNGLNRIRVRDSVVTVDAFTTRETIARLNAEADPEVGILYLLERTLAPLPAPGVRSLAYERDRGLLHIATSAGLASVDVRRLDARAQVPIDKARVYPNPVRTCCGDQNVYLADVSFPARVTIYNLEGEIVSEKQVTAPGVEAWDLKIFVSGGAQGTFFEATSGLYMVRVDTDTGTKIAPLVVIR